jgi:hypothetical protein
VNRRQFLQGASAVSVLVAGGAVWRAYDRGVFTADRGTPFEPWTTWRGDAAEGPLALVRAAILASNAANSQPWLFHVTDSTIDLFADQHRNLGAFDPFLREMHISVGCALENLLLAAAAHGYQTSLTVFSGVIGPVARVQLAHGEPSQSDLYDAIPNRHTNRAPFDRARVIEASFVDELTRLSNVDDKAKLFLFSDDAQRSKIVARIAAAGGVLASHSEIQAGAGRMIHADWHELHAHRDGLTFGDFGESPMRTAMERFFPPSVLRAITPRPSLAAYADVMSTGRLFGLIAVRDRYDRADSVRAGRVWQRAHLLATARGLAARPANQSVELIDHERVWGKEPLEAAALAELTGDASWQPTFMFFMGYATRDAKPTARRGVHEVMV